jgi:hypothetical protein
MLVVPHRGREQLEQEHAGHHDDGSQPQSLGKPVENEKRRDCHDKDKHVERQNRPRGGAFGRTLSHRRNQTILFNDLQIVTAGRVDEGLACREIHHVAVDRQRRY